ncbi:MAG: membrane dipeptidase [Usitatibacter sp.]
MTDTTAKSAADELIAAAVVCDMVLPWGARWIGVRGDTLERFAKSGFNYVSLTVGLDSVPSLEATIQHMAAERRRIESAPDKYVFVESVDDIARAKREGKLALGFHHQGTNALQGDVNMVSLYYRLGVRALLLCYNSKNSVGDGCHEPTNAGLSSFGRTLILEMNRVGMLVDCSHTGHRTTMEAMEVSTSPVIFSHSNARVLRDHERNIRDDQIKACAASGGVIGMNGMGIYIADNVADNESMFRHVDYMCELVGWQHVGLGLDYVYFADGFYNLIRAKPDMYPPADYPIPQAFFEPEQLRGLTQVMIDHGYTSEQVTGILGGNFLRVARQVWK